MSEDARFALDRFVDAQANGIFERALEEIRAGQKRTHWMWFVFPQLAGLGTSEMSERYAIRSLDEARAFLAHEVLGKRLRECALAVLEHTGEDMSVVFGPVDEMKLRSSMTLFARADEGELFSDVLERCFDGEADERTIELLGAPPTT